ncbi:DUF2254 domain-containing protein [Sinorhizobium medicae]|nr:DUF2254 domain-containing protein [Sinorhizobium medicae]MDX0874632.1 DUF2254 domain-containing protein [Sinorhizobium medicae]
MLAAVSVLVTPILQRLVSAHLTEEAPLAALRTLFVTLGGSMLGATAISFSVAMLAVQLNFARIPHSLFRKLSQDAQLVGAFLATFVLSILLGLLSLIPNAAWTGAAIVVALWCITLTLLLFLSAFRRALNLIDPAVQLRLVIADVQKAMTRWSRLANRTTPLLENRQSRTIEKDIPRALFFQSNPHWVEVPTRAIAYSVSFARRYANEGEYDVSAQALNTLVAINRAYVEVRGKTFFAPNVFFNNPLSTENFINGTLEQLRMLAVSATSQGDEQQTIQIMKAFAALVGVYSTIDYGRNHNIELHHAQLATSYLSGTIEGTIARFEADVLMEGVRLLGQSALIILNSGRSSDIAPLAQKIATFSAVGLAKPNFAPVTQTGVEQLATLSFALIRSDEREVRYALREVRSAVATIALVAIGSADTPLSSKHSAHVAAYFSVAKSGSLGHWLTDLTNAVAAAPSGDPDARRVVHHIADWSNELHLSLRQIFVKALENRSGLTIDLVMWITHITTVLVAASKAPSADKRVSAEIRKNATSLLQTFGWIPNDKDTITFAENSQVTTHVFETGLAALKQGVEEVAETARDILMRWAFQGGQNEAGWAIFERSLKAIAVLSVLRENDQWDEWLKAKLAERLGKDAAPPMRERERTARALRDHVDNFDEDGYLLSVIEHVAARADRARLSALFTAIADIIVPVGQTDEANTGKTSGS